jgi:hypothetical protein
MGLPKRELDQQMRKTFTLVLSTALLATSLVAHSPTAAIAEETSTPTTSPMATPTSTPEAKNSDGTYVVGDIGPGGGFIFYVDKKGFKCGPKYTNTGSPTGGLCRYLEVAPSGWKSGKSGDRDPIMTWSTKANYYKDVPDLANFKFPPKSYPKLLVNSGIGNGYKNSLAIVKQGNDLTSAAGAARAYRGSSLGDWYLPTLGELNNLLKWARGLPWKSAGTVVVGGKINSPTYGAQSAGLMYGYWSSNESDREVNDQKFAHSAAWSVVNADSYNEFIQVQTTEKQNTVYVRPIRAF